MINDLALRDYMVSQKGERMISVSRNGALLALAGLVVLETMLPLSAFAVINSQEVEKVKTLMAKPAITPAAMEERDIDRIDKTIMEKELDLLKLNSNLKLHTLPTPWAGRRWWVFNVGGVGLTAAGAYINGFTRFSYLHKKRINRVPKYQLPDAALCRITANCIMVGGGLLEEASLVYRWWKDKRQGVSLPTMRRYADGVQDDVDALLAKREALVSELPAGSNERRLYESEGKVLKDIRDLGVNEFVRYYSDSKSATAFFATSYFWAAASNFIAGAGGITGYQASLTRRGTARQRTRRGGVGGITDIISGSMNTATALVVRVAAGVAQHDAHHKLCRALDCKEETHLDALHAHQEELHNLVSTTPELSVHGTVMKDNVFAHETQILDEHEKIRLGDKAAKKRRLVSQLIFFSGVGPPKLVNGIGTTTAAFHWTDPKQKQKAFRDIGYTATVYGVGYSVAMAELIRSQISNEMRAAKAKREGHSAPQILRREMSDMDKLASAIQTGSPVSELFPDREPILKPSISMKPSWVQKKEQKPESAAEAPSDSAAPPVSDSSQKVPN